jgi:hypothetical protein
LNYNQLYVEKFKNPNEKNNSNHRKGSLSNPKLIQGNSLQVKKIKFPSKKEGFNFFQPSNMEQMRNTSNMFRPSYNISSQRFFMPNNNSNSKQFYEMERNYSKVDQFNFSEKKKMNRLYNLGEMNSSNGFSKEFFPSNFKVRFFNFSQILLLM